MSSILLSLCASAAMVCASGESAAPMTVPRMKPDTALFRIDFGGVSTLRKRLEEERAQQRFQRKKLLRLRLLNEADFGSYTPIVEKAEDDLQQVNLRVARTERLLRWYGVDPHSLPNAANMVSPLRK